MSLASDADGLAPVGPDAGLLASGTRLRGINIAAALVVLLALSIGVGLWAGRGTPRDPEMQALFLSMRAYRLAVASCGASLAMGGVIVQGLFRNPLASPSLLGVEAGAALGGKLVLLATYVLFGGRTLADLSPEMLVPMGCVIGAVLSLAIVLSLTSLRASTVTLILTGFVLNGLFLGVGQFLSSLAQDSIELHRAMTTFAMGSISGAGPNQLRLGILLALAGTLPVLLWSRSLDVLLSGEEEAMTLGVEVTRVRFWCVVWASLVTAGAVAVGGGVGFVGLIVPHAVRRFTGPQHRHLIPASFVAGGAFLILCDAMCRAIPLRQEIPLGVLTELIGAPAFLWMLRRLGHETDHG